MGEARGAIPLTAGSQGWPAASSAARWALAESVGDSGWDLAVKGAVWSPRPQKKSCIHGVGPPNSRASIAAADTSTSPSPIASYGVRKPL
jgi:hypothetical protein